MKPLHIILCLLLVAVPVAANPVAPFPFEIVGGLVGVALVVWAIVATTSEKEINELAAEGCLCTLMLTYDPPLIELTDLTVQPGAYWQGDAARGYLFPLQLGPVNDDCQIIIQLPPVSGIGEEDSYGFWLYHGISRDEWVSDLTVEMTVEDARGTWSGPLTESVYFEPVDAENPVYLQLEFTDSSPEEDTEVNRVFSVFLAVGLLRTPVEGDPEAAALVWRKEPPMGSVLLTIP